MNVPMVTRDFTLKRAFTGKIMLVLLNQLFLY